MKELAPEGFVIINKQGMWGDKVFPTAQAAADYLYKFWLPICGKEYLMKVQKPKFQVVKVSEYKELVERMNQASKPKLVHGKESTQEENGGPKS